jgi:NTE family protein
VSQKVSLVLSGGVALGAYQAGAYAALHAHPDLHPARIAGSSIGAVNAAIIAGNPPHKRVAQLEAFWREARLEVLPLVPDLVAAPWRHAYSWLSVLQTRLFGRSGQFQPRLPELLFSSVPSVYEFTPLRRSLEKYIDFKHLNSGDLRLSVMTTDIETGDEVVFDTHRGATIEPEHLLASCGFVPDFPPVEIGGRLLGDGGLLANAPVECVLRDEESKAEILCLVVDLFSPAGARPETLEQAAARRWDLIFGNQTRRALAALAREYRFRPGRPDVKLVHLAYRAPAHEAGPEKPFDYSRQALSERWAAGAADMEYAVALAAGRASCTNRSVAMSAW